VALQPVAAESGVSAGRHMLAKSSANQYCCSAVNNQFENLIFFMMQSFRKLS
jgi:hypothetical protein